ncbi:MAG: hypothetical protein ACPG4U_01890 [Pseudomonadales bacterium]
MRSRQTFWMIWLVALMPLLLATSMYTSGWFNPSEKVNRGELLHGLHLDHWQLLLAGVPWQHGQQWTLLHTQASGCDAENCKHWQRDLPQVIARLGKDSDRVSYRQVAVSGELTTAQLKQLGDAIWLADPLGNLVLRYDRQLRAEDVLVDLKKLLKLSGIG